MSRTLLYYPTFEIPSEQWIKDGLLYWDEIGSIIPNRFQNILNTGILHYLSSEDLYRCFDPQQLLLRDDVNEQFARELESRLDTPEFAEEIAKSTSAYYWKIAFEKMGYDSWKKLSDRGLTPDEYNENSWIRVKKPAATIYMGLLARYLASADIEHVQPSTDHVEYEDIIYRCGQHQESLLGMSLTLKNHLPRVAPETELSEVVAFKRQRRDELLHFRKFVDETQKRLSNCESEEEAKLEITQFKEQLELGVRTIRDLMEERRIRSVVGTLRAIFTAKSPKWLAAFAGSVGIAGGPIAGAVSSVAGYVAGAAIELAHYRLDMQARYRELRNNPFSLLYQAEQEGIIGNVSG